MNPAQRSRRHRTGHGIGLAFAAALWLGPGAAIATPEPPADPEPAPDALSLEDVMANLARSPGFKAEFEAVSSGAPDSPEPVVSRGTLYFAPPDRLARHLHSPNRSAWIVDGSSVRILDEGGGEVTDSKSRALVRRSFGPFLLLMRGDLRKLRVDYEVQFRRRERNWELNLKPRENPLRQVAGGAVRLVGRGVNLLEMLVRSDDGDQTRTSFSQVDANHEFDERELTAAFPGTRFPPPME